MDFAWAGKAIFDSQLDAASGVPQALQKRAEGSF
jgi:hypothetical protein